MSERAEGYYWVQMPSEGDKIYLALWAIDPGREFNEVRHKMWMMCGYEIGILDEDIRVIAGPLTLPSPLPIIIGNIVCLAKKPPPSPNAGFAIFPELKPGVVGIVTREAESGLLDVIFSGKSIRLTRDYLRNATNADITPPHQSLRLGTVAFRRRGNAGRPKGAHGATVDVIQASGI